MKKELLVKTCSDCGLVFRTESPTQRLCPECVKHSSPHHNLRPRKTKKNTGFPSIAEVSRIEKIYNKVNGTLMHYGDIVQLIRTTDADRCICCGEVIPEGRMVCPECERKAKENWHDGLRFYSRNRFDN